MPLRAVADDGGIDPAKLIEVIHLQKEQLDDYADLVTTQEQQIKDLNTYLNEARIKTDEESEICVEAANDAGWKTIAAYVLGVVGVVFGATVYGVTR